MNENKLDIQRLARWRKESEELFRKIGLRESQYASLLGELADAGTNKIIARASQFLFDFDHYGADAMQERGEFKSRQTPYNHRTFALSLISNSATGN